MSEVEGIFCLRDPGRVIPDTTLEFIRGGTRWEECDEDHGTVGGRGGSRGFAALHPGLFSCVPSRNFCLLGRGVFVSHPRDKGVAWMRHPDVRKQCGPSTSLGMTMVVVP